MARETLKRYLHEPRVEPGTWSWWKEWSGYVVTVLPYVSSGLVIIPGLSIYVKGAILAVFAVIVVVVRVLHEKAGIEVTSAQERKKKPV